MKSLWIKIHTHKINFEALISHIKKKETPIELFGDLTTDTKTKLQNLSKLSIRQVVLEKGYHENSRIIACPKLQVILFVQKLQ